MSIVVVRTEAVSRETAEALKSEIRRFAERAGIDEQIAFTLAFTVAIEESLAQGIEPDAIRRGTENSIARFEKPRLVV